MKKDLVQVKENLISLFYDIVLCYRKKALKREQEKWVGKHVIIDIHPTFDHVDMPHGCIPHGECQSVELRRKLFTRQQFVYFVKTSHPWLDRGLYIKEAIDKVQ